MDGPDILVQTISEVRGFGKLGYRGQYHSRSDHHSKVGCWGIMFDLLAESALLRAHVEAGKVTFGLNHQMGDWRLQRKKKLDLVLATPAEAPGRQTFADLVSEDGIVLTVSQQQKLSELPVLRQSSVGTVLVALEAKATMTAFQKSRPRLYDELNSSHLTIHGAADQAIAVGLALINTSESFISPVINKLGLAGLPPEVSLHTQPQEAERTVQKVKELPRRSGPGEQGFDALAIVLVNCQNDGSPVMTESRPPAPRVDDDYNYAQAIRRVSGIYAYRFSHL